MSRKVIQWTPFGKVFHESLKLKPKKTIHRIGVSVCLYFERLINVKKKRWLREITKNKKKKIVCKP